MKLTRTGKIGEGIALSVLDDRFPT